MGQFVLGIYPCPKNENYWTHVPKTRDSIQNDKHFTICLAYIIHEIIHQKRNGHFVRMIYAVIRCNIVLYVNAGDISSFQHLLF